MGNPKPSTPILSLLFQFCPHWLLFLVRVQIPGVLLQMPTQVDDTPPTGSPFLGQASKDGPVSRTFLEPNFTSA